MEMSIALFKQSDIFIGSEIAISRFRWNKLLLTSDWKQNLPGWVHLKKCPNIALLIYLADHRKVFTAGTAAECIVNNDFSLIQGCEDEPLFTGVGKFTSLATKI